MLNNRIDIIVCYRYYKDVKDWLQNIANIIPDAYAPINELYILIDSEFRVTISFLDKSDFTYLNKERIIQILTEIETNAK